MTTEEDIYEMVTDMTIMKQQIKQHHESLINMNTRIAQLETENTFKDKRLNELEKSLKDLQNSYNAVEMNDIDEDEKKDFEDGLKDCDMEVLHWIFTSVRKEIENRGLL